MVVARDHYTPRRKGKHRSQNDKKLRSEFPRIIRSNPKLGIRHAFLVAKRSVKNFIPSCSVERDGRRIRSFIIVKFLIDIEWLVAKYSNRYRGLQFDFREERPVLDQWIPTRFIVVKHKPSTGADSKDGTEHAQREQKSYNNFHNYVAFDGFFSRSRPGRHGSIVFDFFADGLVVDALNRVDSKATRTLLFDVPNNEYTQLVDSRSAIPEMISSLYQKSKIWRLDLSISFLFDHCFSNVSSLACVTRASWKKPEEDYFVSLALVE